MIRSYTKYLHSVNHLRYLLLRIQLTLIIGNQLQHTSYQKIPTQNQILLLPSLTRIITLVYGLLQQIITCNRFLRLVVVNAVYRIERVIHVLLGRLVFVLTDKVVLLDILGHVEGPEFVISG